MAPATDQPLRDAIAALAAALAELGEPHMLIGGMAVILRGAARQTNDVDATVWGERVELEALLAVLARHGIAGRIPDVLPFARQNQVLLLHHEASRTPMELSLAWLPFEARALERAERLDLDGTSIPVALAEDLIVYKAVAWRDRDRADIERLLVVHRPRIDLAYVRSQVAEFAVLLDEPERVADFERLIERAAASRA